MVSVILISYHTCIALVDQSNLLTCIDKHIKSCTLGVMPQFSKDDENPVCLNEQRQQRMQMHMLFIVGLTLWLTGLTIREEGGVMVHLG